MQLGRFLELVLKEHDRIVFADVAAIVEYRFPVASERELAIFHDSKVSRRQLVYAAIDGLRCWDVSIREVVVDGTFIELTANIRIDTNRLKFRRKR